ncbi:hypothetical protein [Spirillospora sp. NPDC048823]|uniref:deazapurine DNA modification protein DpdA family protein n=1 Tax=unclassified Spirillospora TaxID=2642701 RepID=UPI003717D4EF
MTALATEGTPLFYLGAHQPHWLWNATFPLFVSYRQLARKVGLRPATCERWALDSGGFTYLKDYGRFPISPHEYAAAVRRYRDHIGRLDFAAPQDWMCEPEVIAGGWRGRLYFVGTGLSVAEHQRRTVASYLELRRLAPDLPWIPVLQGWTLAEYARCADLYADAGVDLSALPVVGLGSVCRRQSTTEIRDIVTVFARRGLRLHAFGVKTLGLGLYGHQIASADSMAWSQAAKHEPAWPGHTHKNCANCLPWATAWRSRLLDRVRDRLAERAAHGEQGELFDALDGDSNDAGKAA